MTGLEIAEKRQEAQIRRTSRPAQVPQAAQERGLLSLLLHPSSSPANAERTPPRPPPRTVRCNRRLHLLRPASAASHHQRLQSTLHSPRLPRGTAAMRPQPLQPEHLSGLGQTPLEEVASLPAQKPPRRVQTLQLRLPEIDFAERGNLWNGQRPDRSEVLKRVATSYLFFAEKYLSKRNLRIDRGVLRADLRLNYWREEVWTAKPQEVLGEWKGWKKREVLRLMGEFSAREGGVVLAAVAAVARCCGLYGGVLVQWIYSGESDNGYSREE